VPPQVRQHHSLAVLHRNLRLSQSLSHHRWKGILFSMLLAEAKINKFLEKFFSVNVCFRKMLATQKVARQGFFSKYSISYERSSTKMKNNSK
jgi:hypothetical protein